MFVFQARPALSADLPRTLPRLLVLRPARRPVYPVDAATQPHLLMRRACAPSAAPLSQGMGDCAFSAALPATGACASSAAPLLQDTEDRAFSAASPATGACASSAVPLSQDTGARA